MSHTGKSGASTSSLLKPQYRIEVESETTEFSFANGCQIAESLRSTKRVNSAGLSSASLAVLKRNQELEQKLAKLEKAVAEGVMSHTRRSGASTSSLLKPQYRIEVESETTEFSFANGCQIAESPRSTKGVNSAGFSSASLAVLKRNQELEQKLAKLGKAAAEGTARSGSSRPLGMSSASVALQRRNHELENQLARLENLRMKQYRVSGEDVMPTIWSQASAGCIGSEEQLLMDKRRDERIQNLKLKKVIRQAQELDLAFVVDATASMTIFIEEVKNLAPKIATEVKKAFPKLKLRVAFVPYRDYDEYNVDEAQKCDFTDSFEGPESVFVSAIAKVKPIRNYDDAEDVFSGLERVATLSWSSKTRVLIHIADMPCHGKEFHDDRVGDNYPNGDSKGRDISRLLEALRYDCKILNYLFCHITDCTEKMLKVFRERAPQGGWIQEEKLDKISNLLEVVVSASCKSIAISTRAVGEGPYVPRYKSVSWKNETPQWNNIKQQTGVQFIYKLPATLEDLFKIVESNRSLVLEQKRPIDIQIALRPFSDEGNVRWPYYAQTVYEGPFSPPRKLVVKRFKEHVGEHASKVHTVEAYREQMEVQTVASFMAKHFNHELERLAGLLQYKTVEFTAVSVLQVGGSTYYNMEMWLDGRWIRYSNNVNYVNTKDYAATLHAFSHWTYQRSKGLLMVTDLQGVQVEDSGGKNVFMLCDPAVHCKHVYRYARTRTNWSTAGMDSFFETHRCNNICRSLNLKPKSSSFTRKGTVIS